MVTRLLHSRFIEAHAAAGNSLGSGKSCRRLSPSSRQKPFSQAWRKLLMQSCPREFLESGLAIGGGGWFSVGRLVAKIGRLVSWSVCQSAEGAGTS